jgi:AcrR family transcriptional regulator
MPRIGIETDKRARILDASARLFAEHGFDGTSTKLIATEAGVPSSLLFYYFRTKDTILDALFDDNVTETMMRAFREVRPGSDGIERVINAVHMLFNWLSNHQRQVHILFREVASNSPRADRLKRLRSQAVHLLSQFIKAYCRLGELQDADAELAAQIIGASLVFAVVIDKPEYPQRYIERLISTVL